MGEALDRLVALAGTERVSGYTRHTSTGKIVHVDGYTRDGEGGSSSPFESAKSRVVYGGVVSTPPKALEKQIEESDLPRLQAMRKQVQEKHDKMPEFSKKYTQATLDKLDKAIAAKGSKIKSDGGQADDSARLTLKDGELKSLSDVDLWDEWDQAKKDKDSERVAAVEAEQDRRKSKAAVAKVVEKSGTQTPIAKEVEDIVKRSKGKRGASLSDLAYALGKSPAATKVSIQHGIDSGHFENRHKGNGYSLFPVSKK